jgi:hypothetical protein
MLTYYNVNTIIIFPFRKVSSSLLFLGTDDIITTTTKPENKLEKLGKDVSEELGIPPWGLVAILIGNKRTRVFLQNNF